MYFKNNCGHVFVDGSKVIVETDTFKRTTEFYSIFNSSIQMEFNDSIVELEIYSNVKKISDAILKEYGVDQPTCNEKTIATGMLAAAD